MKTIKVGVIIAIALLFVNFVCSGYSRRIDSDETQHECLSGGHVLLDTIASINIGFQPESILLASNQYGNLAIVVDSLLYIMNNPYSEKIDTILKLPTRMKKIFYSNDKVILMDTSEQQLFSLNKESWNISVVDFQNPQEWYLLCDSLFADYFDRYPGPVAYHRFSDEENDRTIYETTRFDYAYTIFISEERDLFQVALENVILSYSLNLQFNFENSHFTPGLLPPTSHILRITSEYIIFCDGEGDVIQYFFKSKRGDMLINGGYRQALHRYNDFSNGYSHGLLWQVFFDKARRSLVVIKMR